MEALTEANRQASEGLKVLVERRNEILRETLSGMASGSQRRHKRRSDVEAGRGCKHGLQKAMANFRELSEMEAQARNNAWKVVQERMQENMANLQKLLQPK